MLLDGEGCGLTLLLGFCPLLGLRCFNDAPDSPSCHKVSWKAFPWRPQGLSLGMCERAGALGACFPQSWGLWAQDAGPSLGVAGGGASLDRGPGLGSA